MKTPKMMATRITTSNYDVVSAIAPDLVCRYENSGEINGEFIVINEPSYVSTEFGFNGIMLDHSIMTEEEFRDRFAWAKSNNPFGNRFIPVRHKSPVLEEFAPIHRPTPFNRRPRVYPRR